MNQLRVALLFTAAVAVSEAFAPTTSTITSTSTTSRSRSALSALPPLIIGPMIKKMREENKKKDKPMIDESEAASQAPGLKVGKGAWKWPNMWPYDPSFFTPGAESSAEQASPPSMNSMAGMLTGIAQVPTENEGQAQQANKFDPIQYWDQEQASVPTLLDPQAIEKLKEHYSYYLVDGMAVLELGAAENSYLPDGIQLERHVGVGASKSVMTKNPSLTDAIVVDLNKVTPDRDVDSDELRLLAADPFDVVIMANTVNFLTSPRETFRSAWYLLKPGGTMIVAFAGREASKDMFPEAQTKMWRDYSDDQKLWITGSFFQFSAGDGWETLMGFDISPADAKSGNADKNPLAKFLDRGKANTMYVVQATKGFQYDSVDAENYDESIRSLCWMLPAMEQRDKSLVVPRLARACETGSDEVVEAIGRNIQHLPAIYEALIKMDQFAFTFPMQAQMAADMVSNPDFGGTEEEIMALKQGLGLRKPGPEFWAPVGEKTSAIPVEDKISLLAYIVPCFGSGDPAQEEGLEAFVSGLGPTYTVIRSKCPDLSEAEVQLVGAELLATEVLKPGRSTRQEFAVWLAALSDTELREMLTNRKSIREAAKSDLQAFRHAREDAKAKQAEYTQQMSEQVDAARQARSLIFNPKTRKMEVFENPNKK